MVGMGQIGAFPGTGNFPSREEKGSFLLSHVRDKETCSLFPFVSTPMGYNFQGTLIIDVIS